MANTPAYKYTGIERLSEIFSYIKDELDTRCVQADWNESDNTKYSFIKNKPTIPTKVSDLTNDSGYITGITSSMVTTALGYTPYDSSNPSGYTSNIGTVTQVKVGTTAYNPSSGVVSLPAYPTSLPASDVYSWAKASTKPSYSYSEITSRPTKLSDLTNDLKLLYMENNSGSSASYSKQTEKVSAKFFLVRCNTTGVNVESNNYGGTILSTTWESGNYNTELFMGMGDHLCLYYRGNNGSSYTNWYKIAFTSDIPDISTKVSKSGDTMSGNLTFSGSAGIQYTGTKATYGMIKFKDNTSDAYGNGIIIGGGGLTIIGGGEAADTIAAQYSTGGSEVLELGSDAHVYIRTNLNNGYSSGKTFTFSSDGSLTVPDYLSCAYLKTDTNITYGRNGLQYFNQSTSTTSGASSNANPTAEWYHIIRMNHGNNSGYFVDVAFPLNHNSCPAYRMISGGSDNGWRDLIDCATGYIPVTTSPAAGWRRICKITYGQKGYQNGFLLISGGWNNGKPSNATIAINCINTGASMVLLSNNATDGLIQQVRLVNVSGSTFWVDAYMKSQSNGVSEQFFKFFGNFKISEIQKSATINTDSVIAAATINLTVTRITGMVITSDTIGSQSVSYATSAGSATSATTASKLGSSTVGSATQPIYLSSGTAIACTYTLGTNVPSNAVFTDTNNAVTQTNITTSDNGGRVLFSNTNDDTTRTEGAKKANHLQFYPISSTGTLTTQNKCSILYIGKSSSQTGYIGFYSIDNTRVTYLKAGAADSARITVNMPASTGTLALAGSSSRKVKKNISDMTEDEANKLFNLRPVNYDYINEKKGTDCYGFIAEEVEAIGITDPIIDTTFPTNDDDVINVSGLDYAKFVPYLVKVVQMQQKQIEALKSKML